MTPAVADLGITPRTGLWGGGGGGGGEGRGRGRLVWRGSVPLASKGVWGSAVGSPVGVWGGAPEAFTLYALNPAKN